MKPNKKQSEIKTYISVLTQKDFLKHLHLTENIDISVGKIYEDTPEQLLINQSKIRLSKIKDRNKHV